MKFPSKRLLVLVAVAMAAHLVPDTGAAGSISTPAERYLSPTALAASADGGTLFIACAMANRVLRFDTASQKVTGSIPVPEPPSGLALSVDGRRLYVTCAAPASRVCLVDVRTLKITGNIPAGHTAMAPVLDPSGRTLYVCNRFNNNVSVIDLAARKERRRIPVRREPVAAAMTKDGKFLLVANYLPDGPANADYVAAVVSVIDLAQNRVVKELRLPNGSGSVNDLRVSPDGKYAAVTHLVGNFRGIPTRTSMGWINANGLTLIDLAKMEVSSSVLLDKPYAGAANPWGLAWSADSRRIVVAHAGSHEVSVIDFPALLAGLARPLSSQSELKESERVLDFPSQPGGQALPFLVGARTRVKLREGDYGSRAVVIVGQTAYTANYFSDTLSRIDLNAPQLKAESIPLGPRREMDVVRKGEFYFHDGGICFEGWQSCASCHPGDARVDGLNWDLLNDGIDNPKNTRSLLLAYQIGPVMSLGVRASAETAVRAGIRHILFAEEPEEVPAVIDAYLKSLKPVPSPWLVHGELSKAAQRGSQIFTSAGCSSCHQPPVFADLRPHDVGTRSAGDGPADKFYTPPLVEIWRTAPYLHDGSAATVRDVVTTRNPHDKHGETSSLTREEIDDLCAYLLSL